MKRFDISKLLGVKFIGTVVFPEDVVEFCDVSFVRPFVILLAMLSRSIISRFKIDDGAHTRE